MIKSFTASRIPELDGLINDKLDEIAALLGEERGLEPFDQLSEDEQDELLNDAFDLVEGKVTPSSAGTGFGSPSAKLQSLLAEQRTLSQEMRDIHAQVDRIVDSSD